MPAQRAHGGRPCNLVRRPAGALQLPAAINAAKLAACGAASARCYPAAHSCGGGTRSLHCSQAAALESARCAFAPRSFTDRGSSRFLTPWRPNSTCSRQRSLTPPQPVASATHASSTCANQSVIVVQAASLVRMHEEASSDDRSNPGWKELHPWPRCICNATNPSRSFDRPLRGGADTPRWAVCALG
jgi:hypothetical protein